MAATDGQLGLIRPDWPAPAGVVALATTRRGGCSRGSWAGLNLAGHTGDDPGAVERNRRLLIEACGLPRAPCWLNQVHGTVVADADRARREPTADAAVASRPGTVLAVLTADCLPVALCAEDGSVVAVAHAGWRGLLDGVIEAVLGAIGQRGVAPGRLLAWLGPVIGPAAYEVGAEVRDAFVARDPGAGAMFAANAAGRWQCDLAGLARRRLELAGVRRVYGGTRCTYGERLDDGRPVFFSYRRDGCCGRQATLIWRRVGPGGA